jgi:hypothetical protein
MLMGLKVMGTRKKMMTSSTRKMRRMAAKVGNRGEQYERSHTLIFCFEIVLEIELGDEDTEDEEDDDEYESDEDEEEEGEGGSSLTSILVDGPLAEDEEDAEEYDEEAAAEDEGEGDEEIDPEDDGDLDSSESAAKEEAGNESAPACELSPCFKNCRFQMSVFLILLFLSSAKKQKKTEN